MNVVEFSDHYKVHVNQRVMYTVPKLDPDADELDFDQLLKVSLCAMVIDLKRDLDERGPKS